MRNFRRFQIISLERTRLIDHFDCQAHIQTKRLIMNFIKRCLIQFPLLTTILLVLVGVAVIRIPTQIFSDAITELYIPWLGVLGRSIGSCIFIGIMLKFSWAREAGISQSYNLWHKRWFIIISPMLIIGLINFTGVQWNALQISWLSLITLLSDNIAVGLFEETMMRGFAFYVLYRAWQHQSNGIYKAAIAQALIFGLLHLFNLASGFQVDVIAQVIYATLLGIGFAGVVAYTRTIWTAVFAHSFINIIGSINTTLNPNYIDSPNSVASYIILTTIILVLVTLPGLWCLKKANDLKFEGATV